MATSKPNRKPTGRPGGSARARSAAFRAAQQRAERRRRIAIWVGAAVLVVAAATGISVAVANSGSSKPAASGTTSTSTSASASGAATMGPEGIVLEAGTVLAPASTAATGQTVDGIQCNTNEQVAYHIHTHLAVYVNGVLRPLPPGIGIVSPVAESTAQGDFYQASKCYYWLHVHAQDGVIHIEAPSQQTYTLGQFFAVWRQPLSLTKVGPAAGKVTVYVDGKPFAGDPASIVLKSREDVQLDIGTPTVAPVAVDWSKSQL